MCIVFSEPNTIMYCKRINRLVSGWMAGVERHQPTTVHHKTNCLIGWCWLANARRRRLYVGGSSKQRSRVGWGRVARQINSALVAFRPARAAYKDV